MGRTGQAVLAILSLGVAAYAAAVYALLPIGAAVHPDMRAGFQAHPVGLYLHAFGAALALALGPFQFMSGVRTRRPAWHRWSGRFYLGVGVLLGGLSGLYLAMHAYGGPAARLGFAALALAWLYSAARAYLAVRAGEFARHRRWMVRNFSLAFAAVTLRLYLTAALASGVALDTAYPVVAWLCWLPNLMAAEWLLGHRPAQAAASAVRHD